LRKFNIANYSSTHNNNIGSIGLGEAHETLVLPK